MGPAAILSVLVKTQGVQQASGQLAKLDATAKRSGDTMKSVNKGAGIMAVGVLGIGAAAVKTAADYESSMNTLKAVSNATGGEMRKLSRLSMKLGADVHLPATSAKDAAEAMTEMIKAGVSLKNTMAGVRSVLVLSAAAGVSNAEAAEIASNALNAFKLKGKDVAMVADQLANTANASSVEIRDVADSMKMAAAVFSGFQAPVLGAKGALTELNVAVGLLGNAGIKGSDAGTSLKQTLLQLTGPSDKAKAAMKGLFIAARGNSVSQEKLNQVIHGGAKDRGEAVAQLEKMNPALKKGGDIAYDSAGKMRSLKDIIKLTAAGTKDMTQEQKNAYLTQIFGADATRTVIALMNAGPAAWDKMTKAVTKQGAAQSLADAKMKGLKGSFEAFKSTMETLAITFGTVLLPALTSALKGVTGLLNGIDPKVLGITVAAFGALAAAVWVLTAAMAANPATLIAAGLILLGAALVTAYQKIETFRTGVDAAFAGVKVAVAALGPVFTAMVTWVTGAFNAVKAALSSATAAIAKEVGSWKVLFAVFGVIATIVKFNMGVVVAVVRSALTLIAPLFTATFGVLKAIVAGAFNAMKAIVQGGLQVVHGVIQVFGGIFKGDFHQMWEGIKNIFKGIGSAISGILRAQLGTVAAAGKALGKGLLDSFKAALNFAHELAVQMRDLISKAPGYALGVGKAIVRGIISGIKAAAGGIAGALKGAVQGAAPDFLGIGDGIGKSIGAGSIAPVKGGGSLMGARPIMSKFAAVGAAKGLHVTSGMRAGAITSSGNPSWHGTGEAIDLGNGAGPDAAKMSVFKTLRSRFGSRLAELIYGPGVVGIKNGQPYNFGGALNAQHMDHVHVAFDSGKPGQGDGIGRTSGARKAMTGDGGGNVKAVWQFLLANGFTSAQAAGIIGVMQGESGKGLSTTATNPKSGAYGIAQWLGGRKSALMAKKNPSSLKTQLNHLMSELRGPEKGAMSKIKGAKSVEDAVKAWLFGFERPGPGEEDVAGRTSNAKSVLASLKGVVGKGGASGKAGGKAAAQKVSNYEMIQAMADTALASAASTPGVADDTLANTQLRDATTFRIKQVRKALKKPNLTPAKRLSLTQELGGLVGKHTELQSTLKDLRTQPGFDALDKQTGINDARLSMAQGTESLADDLPLLQNRVDLLGKVFELTQKKFGAGSVEAAQAFADLTGAAQTLAKTQRDAVFQPYQDLLKGGSAALTAAQVFTPGNTEDDLAALNSSLAVATQAFLEGVNRGDADAINEFGGQVLSLRDSIEQLSANVEANTKAQLDLQTQLREAAQRNFNVSQTELGTLQKAIAAVANREIGGGTGLGFMSPSFAGGGTRY